MAKRRQTMVTVVIEHEDYPSEWGSEDFITFLMRRALAYGLISDMTVLKLEAREFSDQRLYEPIILRPTQ